MDKILAEKISANRALRLMIGKDRKILNVQKVVMGRCQNGELYYVNAIMLN